MAAPREVLVPDIGEFESVDVIEVLVGPGDRVEVEQSLITLESEKATMEVPSPAAGVVKELRVAVGDQVSEGSVILVLEAAEAKGAARKKGSARKKGAARKKTGGAPKQRAGGKAPGEAAQSEGVAQAPGGEAPPPRGREGSEEREIPEAGPAQMLSGAPALATGPTPGVGKAHASPSVRRLAHELGVELARVRGSGRKGRIVKEDVQLYVKQALASGAQPPAPSGFAVPELPQIDFSRWGEIEIQPLPKMRRVSARNLHRAWLTVPHVTQFDEADITELEAFRREKQEEAAERGVKLTLLCFFLKACALLLEEFPQFNSSLDRGGEALVLKRYVNVGVAVDTEMGLVVPVIRNVDQKGLLDLAEELGVMSQKARDRKLRPEDIQGGTFSISSLGGIGGTAFTPIVNAPEVAILGVARSRMAPLWDPEQESFVPRLMVPLCLSYDHRVIDGADAVRFTTRLKTVLSDIRNLIL